MEDLLAIEACLARRCNRDGCAAANAADERQLSIGFSTKMSRLSKSQDHDNTTSRSDCYEEVVAVVFVSRTSSEKSDSTCFCEWHEQSNKAKR